MLKFTEKESSVICRVLGQATGSLANVTKVFGVRSIIWQNKDKEFELNQTDLSVVVAIIMSHNQFTVDEVPLLIGITQSLSKELKALESKNGQKQEATTTTEPES